MHMGPEQERRVSMNRKCKKIGIFIGLTMAITGMTACGETEPEETPVVKEETAKPTETPAPTSTPTPTPTPIPEYVDYDYEEAGVTIQIPGMLWDIKPEKTDSGLIFTAPDEKWLVRFYPLTYDRKIRVYDNLTNVFGEDGSKVKDKNLSSVSIEEGDYGNSGYKYKRYTWALDVEKASAYESFITAYPHIVEIINYDQTAIEGYNAILVEVTTPEGLDEAGSLDREQFYAYTSLKESLSRDIQDQTATREKYPDVSDIDTKETRRFVENLTFAEGGSTIAASIDGVELEIPAFWEIIPTSAEQHLLVSFNRGTEEKGSLAIHPATMNGYDPVYNALLGCGRGAGVDRDDQEEIQARFKAAEADGLVKEFKAGKTVFYGAYSPVSHKLSFNTLFTKEHCLCIELYFLKELSKEELWDYAQGENFQTVLNSMKIDVNIPTAEEIQIDRSFDISNDGVLKKYKGTDPEVIISDVIKGIEVKEIGEYAFYNCADVKKVVISSAVERIDKGAFANCAALEEVTLPSTLKYLGDYAFEDCSSLTKIELPDGLEEVGVEAFSKTSIEKLRVPGSMKVIGTNVFGDMMNLHEIHIEEGVEEIGESAFQGAGSRDTYDAPEHWVFMDKEMAARYADHIIDPAVHTEIPWWINIYLPSTIKKIGDAILAGSRVEGIYMESFDSVESLPEFYVGEEIYETTFGGIEYLSQIYFTKDTIDKCGKELDEFFMSLPFGEDWAWYYEGNDIYWIDESARDFMTPEDLKTVFGE